MIAHYLVLSFIYTFLNIFYVQGTVLDAQYMCTVFNKQTSYGPFPHGALLLETSMFIKFLKIKFKKTCGTIYH